MYVRIILIIMERLIIGLFLIIFSIYYFVISAKTKNKEKKVGKKFVFTMTVGAMSLILGVISLVRYFSL